MIELHQVAKEYQTYARTVQALKNADLTVRSGEAVLITGPSGSGKSTLLGVLSGLICPTAGRVSFEGADLYFLPDAFISALRQKRFCFVFQRHQLVPELTVAENVSLPLLPQNLNAQTMRHRVEQVLARLEISALARARVKTLSGGEQQRVALARAFVNGGDIVIADEPTASLDPQLVRLVITLFTKMKQNGHTLLVSSHDSSFDNLELWDRKLAVCNGEICERKRKP